MDGIGKRYTCEQRDFSLRPCCMLAENNSKIKIEGRTYSFFDSPRPALNKNENKKAGLGRSCAACGKAVLGFVYHCTETDENFHPACFKLLDYSKLDIPDAKFLLKKEQVSSTCALCKRKLPEGVVKKIPGWSYVVEDEDEDLTFHVYCIMELAMDMHSSSSKSNNGLLSTEGTKVLPKKISKKETVVKTESSSSKSNKDLLGTEVLPKPKSKKISKTESVVKPESSSSKNNKELSPALKETKVLPESKSKKISKTKLVKESDSPPSKSNKHLSLPLKGTKVQPETKSKEISKTKSVVKPESSSSKNNKDLASTSKGTEVLPESKSKRSSKTKLVKESDSVPSKSNKDLSLLSKGTEVHPKTKSEKISKTKTVVKNQSSSSKSNKDLASTSKGTEVVVRNKSNEISKTKPKKSFENKKWLISVLKFFISATLRLYPFFWVIQQQLLPHLWFMLFLKDFSMLLGDICLF